MYPSYINEWFSAAIGRKVLLLHSDITRRQGLNPNRHIHMKDGDIRKTFTTDAALHIVNETSVEELRQRVIDQYPEGLHNLYVDAEQFRSNIVIQTEESFSEDLYGEIRIGNCFMRNAGPTARCNAIRTNWDKETRVDEEEPYKTLSKFRNYPGLGMLFGMYY